MVVTSSVAAPLAMVTVTTRYIYSFSIDGVVPKGLGTPTPPTNVTIALLPLAFVGGSCSLRGKRSASPMCLSVSAETPPSRRGAVLRRNYAPTDTYPLGPVDRPGPTAFLAQIKPSTQLRCRAVRIREPRADPLSPTIWTGVSKHDPQLPNVNCPQNDG